MTQFTNTYMRRYGAFQQNYALLNSRALKFSYLYKINIFQCMGKIFCEKLQRVPLKFHTKYLTQELLDLRADKWFWNTTSPDPHLHPTPTLFNYI